MTITYVYSDDYFTTRSTLYVQAASIPLDIAFNGTGIGLGTHAENPNLFDIGLPTNIRGNLKVDGTISSADQHRIKWQIIPTGADLNDDIYKAPGHYRSILGTNQIANRPPDFGNYGAFELIVTGISDAAYCTQWLKDISTNRSWVRTQTNWKTPWTWTDWAQMITTDATNRGNALNDLVTGNSYAGNLDDLKTAGTYWVNLSNCQNGPASSGYGSLEVTLSKTNQFLQRFTFYTGAVAYRTFVNNQWYAWATLVNAPAVADSGWNKASIAGNFALYGSDSVLRYRKIGHVVQVEGTVKPTTTLSGSATNLTIFTLPAGYRPSVAIVTLCQGSGSCHWALTIKASGEVCFGRYSSGGSYTSAGTGTWLPFHHTFMV